MAAEMADVANTLLRARDLGVGDISTGWLTPGGPKVLTALEDALGLDRSATELTWHSLREAGNLSSASVLDVLRRTLEQSPASGDPAVLVAMGPGFCAELVLLRVVTGDVDEWFVLLIAAVGVERIVELVMSERHIAWANDHGGVELGREHYPVMVLIHVGLLVGSVLEVVVLGRAFFPGWVGRCWSEWAAQSLGGGASDPRAAVEHPDRRRSGCRAMSGGPYRCFDHPNYLAVVVEGVCLPLVHTAWITAISLQRMQRIRAPRASARRGSRPGDARADTRGPVADRANRRCGRWPGGTVCRDVCCLARTLGHRPRATRWRWRQGMR